MDKSKIIEFILFFPAFLFSLSFHEASHAWVAGKLGDPTAKSLGRVTLNPLPHMDLIGTVLLPAVGFFLGGFIIGWGNPVPVDYRNLKNWKKDGMFIALAGPVGNLVLAALFSIVFHVILKWAPQVHEIFFIQPNIYGDALMQFFYLNLALTFFNLIPVHPLDGGKIIFGLLPAPYAQKFDLFMLQYGTFVLLILFATGAFRYIVGVPTALMASLLL